MDTEEHWAGSLREIRSRAEKMGGVITCKDCGAVIPHGEERAGFEGTETDGSPYYHVVCLPCHARRTG